MKTIKQTSKRAMLILALVTTIFTFAQKPIDGSKIVMSKYSFSETVDRVKGDIENQNLMVIAELDGQKNMRLAGKKTKGMKQIFFLNPMYMRKVAEANNMAGIQIPLKLIIKETDKGVLIRYFLPTTILRPYKGTENVANELDDLVVEIITEVTK